MTPDREPPQDLDSEMATLGSMMNDPSVVDDVLEVLPNPEAFYTPAHRHLHEVLIDMHRAGKPIDFISVSAILRERGLLETVGSDYMIQLAESHCDTANAAYYAGLVATAWQRRQLISIAGQLSHLAYSLTDEPAELSARYAKEVENVSLGGSDGSLHDAVELLSELPATMADNSKSFVRTGISLFDQECGGLERGSLTILAARPSVGKTSLGLAFAVDCARAGGRALFVSVEMPRMQIAKRLLALVSDIPSQVLRTEMAPEDIDNACQATGRKIGDGRLWIADEIANVRDIASTARAVVRRHEVVLIVVDYLQLCTPAAKCENRNLEVASMSASFKALAMKTGAAVVVLSQLGRDAAKSNRRPMLSDLRDSGAIEQDADMVAFLWRQDKETTPTSATVRYLVEKNRSGPTLDMRLLFHKPTMRFRSERVGENV